MADQEAVRLLTSEDLGDWLAFRRKSPERLVLRYGKFDTLSLDGFDLSNCDFDGAYFNDCGFKGTNFGSSSINGANFRKCILSAASFRGASLSSTAFDRCEVDGTDFSNSRGLSSDDLESSFGDENTILPPDVDPPQSWGLYIDEIWDNEDQEDKVEVSSLPRIPARVFAPVETIWQDEILNVAIFENRSVFGDPVEDGVVRALKESLADLIETLANTNFDQRVVQQLAKQCESFPSSGKEFRSRIFSIWFALRPAFEYLRITRDQHSSYTEAKVTAFEMSLRDAMLSYPEWREYDQATQAIRVTDQFDDRKFVSHQIEFISSLSKSPEFIDTSVVEGLNRVVDVQKQEPLVNRSKSILYGVASSFANVISRLIKKVIDEIASGSLEGIKEGTKKLVSSTIAAGGGGVLLWFLATGMDSFVWLKRAWEFVKAALAL